MCFYKENGNWYCDDEEELERHNRKLAENQREGI